MSIARYIIGLVAALLPTFAFSQALDYTVLDRYPHSTSLFTQGLELYQGKLFESSGLYGHSKLISRPFPPRPDAPLRGVALDKQLFAEGLSFYRGRLYLLTWRAGLALEIDPEHFRVLKRHRYQGQGWGLCYHPTRQLFAMSDGSNQLQWRRPSDFSLVERLPVRGPAEYQHLNELECHGEYVLANRWHSNSIAVIQADSGEVVGEIDLSELVPPGLHKEAVLNGIAYDSGDDSWLVTGKLWPHIYRIRFALPAPKPLKSAPKAP